MSTAGAMRKVIKDGAKYSKTTALWDTVKGAAKNIGSTNWKTAEYLPSAIKGALWGAGIEGTTEWAQGGSFWAGARSGAFTGAMVGAGYRAAKVGAFGENFAYGKNGGIKNLGGTAKRYQGMYENNVSKQVTAIQRKNAGVATAEAKVTKNRKLYKR